MKQEVARLFKSAWVGGRIVRRKLWVVDPVKSEVRRGEERLTLEMSAF